MRYVIRERQVITYEWEVDVEGIDEADAATWEGVPDQARTVYFDSENEIRLCLLKEH